MAADAGSDRLPLAVVVAATAVLGSVSLIFPFGRDQGIFAYLGTAVLHGQVMYRDILMGVLPLPPLVYAAGLALFGHSMLAVRLLDLLWTAATGICLFYFVRRRLGRPWAGALAGSLYAFLYYLCDYWNTCQPDGLLNLPVAAALALAAAGGDSSDTGRRWAVAGVLIGAALLFKYTIGLLLPGLALLLVVVHRRRLPTALRDIVALAAGAAGLLAAAALILVAFRAMAGFIDGQVSLAVPYSGLAARPSLAAELAARLARLWGDGWRYPETRIALASLPVILAMLLVPAWRRRAGGSALLPAALVWLVCALVSIGAQGKFFRYHYLPLLAPVAALGAAALAPPLGGLLARFRPPVLRVLVVAVLAVAVVAGSAYRPRYRDLAAVAAGRLTLRDYDAGGRHNSGTDFSLGDVMAVSDYLRAHTRPQDRVLVWSLEPLVNFLSGRQSTTRFIYDMPLIAAWAPARYRAEFLSSFTRQPAAVLVVCHHDEIPWVLGHDKDSFQSLLEFTEFRDFVADNYQLEAQVGRYDVLRLAAGN